MAVPTKAVNILISLPQAANQFFFDSPVDNPGCPEIPCRLAIKSSYATSSLHDERLGAVLDLLSDRQLQIFQHNSSQPKFGEVNPTSAVLAAVITIEVSTDSQFGQNSLTRVLYQYRPFFLDMNHLNDFSRETALPISHVEPWN